MSSFGMPKGLLEIGKFAMYVIVPIALTYAVTTNSKNLQKIMGFHQYVVYPLEGPRPPSPEELRGWHERWLAMTTTIELAV